MPFYYDFVCDEERDTDCPIDNIKKLLREIEKIDSHQELIKEIGLSEGVTDIVISELELNKAKIKLEIRKIIKEL